MQKNKYMQKKGKTWEIVAYWVAIEPIQNSECIEENLQVWYAQFAINCYKCIKKVKFERLQREDCQNIKFLGRERDTERLGFVRKVEKELERTNESNIKEDPGIYHNRNNRKKSVSSKKGGAIKCSSRKKRGYKSVCDLLQFVHCYIVVCYSLFVLLQINHLIGVNVNRRVCRDDNRSGRCRGRQCDNGNVATCSDTRWRLHLDGHLSRRW